MILHAKEKVCSNREACQLICSLIIPQVLSRGIKTKSSWVVRASKSINQRLFGLVATRRIWIFQPSKWSNHLGLKLMTICFYLKLVICTFGLKAW